MNIHRLSDWFKLSSMLVAAALLAGCDNAADDAAPGNDVILDADSTFDDAGTGDVMIEEETYGTNDPEPVNIDPEPSPLDAPVAEPTDEPVIEPTDDLDTP